MRVLSPGGAEWNSQGLAPLAIPFRPSRAQNRQSQMLASRSYPRLSHDGTNGLAEVAFETLSARDH